MPSRMCLSSVHNTKRTLHSSDATSKQRWEESSCAMESLYDIDLISRTVPVVLDNSKTWHEIVSKITKLEEGVVAHVQGISRAELKENPMYSKALLINRTTSTLAWFMECKDRKNRSSVMLSYTFLPSMPAKKLRDAANKMKEILGDYDAIHVRRGDLLKNRKDRFGVDRSLHPHLDRDTRPEFIRKRIVKWIPPGRTLFIASNERIPGFFSPLSDRCGFPRKCFLLLAGTCFTIDNLAKCGLKEEEEQLPEVEEEEEEEEPPVGQQEILSLRERLKAGVRRRNQANAADAAKASCSSSVQALVRATSPDDSRIRAKTIYAVSRNQFRHELDGVHFEIQATDPNDMDLEVLRGCANRT